MKLLFYLGHPAHFHLFKNVIHHFNQNGHETFILIKKKDVLEDLLKQENLPYLNIFPGTRGDSKISMAKTILKRNIRLLNFCLNNKPDLLIGTSVENTHIGKLLNIPTLNLNEDDHTVVPLYCQLSYPLANTILCPTVCTTGRWEHKTIHYPGYHELAYLHPKVFTPDYNIVKKYIPSEKPYFLIRFARLKAHHDKGIRGIDNYTAVRLIETLKPFGNVYITSEKELDKEFEKYRINVLPKDMHSILAYASLYIGDSQTMAAEAGVLGTPFLRFNDFVGKIGYLNELENYYKLGFGISPDNPARLLQLANRLVNIENLASVFAQRREKMLNEKINLNDFLIWFIINFPKSKAILNKNAEVYNNFITKQTRVDALLYPKAERISAPERLVKAVV